MSDTLHLIQRAHALLDRLESLVPNGRAKTPDWDAAVAFRWHHGNGRVRIEPIMHRAPIRLRDLLGIDVQKEALERNTRQFLHGLPANNALLWGPRGTGKSSLIKALLNEYHADGLRLIEVDRHDLIGIHEIASVIADRPERFILFCDDLSFDEHDSSYKALKAAVDGGVFSPPDNLLIYATSNRRHLLPEMKRENLDSRTVDGEIHYAEAIEEKISLSERFGVWLAFHPFKQEDYLAIVHHWLKELSAPDADGAAVREAALQWALLHGSRSGRSAWQFAKDWAGSRALQNMAARYRTLGNGDIR